MTANGGISIVRNDEALDNERLGASRESMPAESRQAQFNQMLNAGQLNATGSVLLNSGGYLALRGTHINAGKDVTLLAGHNADLNARELGERFSFLFPDARTPELASRVHAGGNLLINAARDIGTQGGALSANGNVTLLAGQNLWLSALGYSIIDAANDNNKDARQLVTRLSALKDMTLAANNQLTTYGAQLTSGGNMMLTSGGNMRFEAVQSRTYREGGNEFTESMAQQGSVLNAGGLMTLISNGSILFQATKLVTKSAMDVAAKGGYLYAQAMEESSHYEKKEVKRKWWGKKTEVTRVRHDVTNKVTEFTAAGNISLLSRDDSTYEASKISAGQNARLVSTQGAINFRAVKNTSFEQTVSLSKGFYIKQADKGYTDTLWVLPSVYTGGTLTVEASSGISADIKAQNGQVLQSAIDALGNTPGSTWVKNINKRSDVQWGVVKDAYDSWDYKSQSLNPAVAAVIAITVAAVTAGSGLAAMAGNAAVSATGAAGTTAAMVSGAAAAGTASLASQAAVALVENQGNISKTLKALGNSDTVKATATAMAIGGALNGFDTAMGWSQDANGKVINPNNVKLPQLSNGDWSKVVQRVAGQSIIGSSLNTTINGGSFKDNLTNSLLANIGGQVNAEGAKLIGDNGSVLGVPGKMLSHAVVAGISAEIGRGDGKGAAAGALAAELAGSIMGSSLFEPKYRSEIDREVATLLKSASQSETSAQVAKVLGGLAGAIATRSPTGAYSGADAAELVQRFNFDEHLLDPILKEANADFEAAKNGDKAAQKRVDERTQAAMLIIDYVPIAGGVKGAMEAQTGLDYFIIAASIVPGLGTAAQASLKTAKKLLKEGNVQEATKLVSAVRDEISTLRPSWRQSEKDIGQDLGAGWREQASFKGGVEVPYGTKGSVRPDWCQGTVCSVEVKNYNITTNQEGLISTVSKQAIERQVNLPAGMQQQVIIDIRGQVVSIEKEREIIKEIVKKSNGAVNPANIEFKR